MESETNGFHALIVIVTLLAIALSFLSLRDIRTFGVYSNHTCAYEETKSGKSICPKTMPGRYDSFIVSDNALTPKI